MSIAAYEEPRDHARSCNPVRWLMHGGHHPDPASVGAWGSLTDDGEDRCAGVSRGCACPHLGDLDHRSPPSHWPRSCWRYRCRPTRRRTDRPAFSPGRSRILVLVAVAGGWILVDRLVALGIPVVGIALVLLATAAGSYLVSRVHMLDDLGLYRGDWRSSSISLTYGGLVRGATDGRRSMASLVVISAVTSWLTYDIPRLPCPAPSGSQLISRRCLESLGRHIALSDDIDPSCSRP